MPEIQSPAPVAQPSAGFFSKRWVQNAALVLATAAVAYGMVYADVIARAREAFRQGALYAKWHANPELKRQAFEAKFLKEKEKLDRKKEKGEISADVYAQDLEVLEFDRNQTLTESSVKYAYQWYKDTYELFSPPESLWVRRARYLAPAAKQQWREELQSKNIPFEEYMLDLEAGEDAGTLMVYSTRDRGEAQRCLDALKAKGIEARLYDGPANGRLPQEGLKIIAPRESFWDAHEAIKDIVAPPLSAEAQ